MKTLKDLMDFYSDVLFEKLVARAYKKHIKNIIDSDNHKPYSINKETKTNEKRKNRRTVSRSNPTTGKTKQGKGRKQGAS